MEDILTDMAAKEFNSQVEQNFGITVKRSSIEQLPETKEELDLHMQLYLQASCRDCRRASYKCFNGG